MEQNKLKSVGFLGGAYAVAIALLFLLVLRSIAVQISPEPTILDEPYPDVSTEEKCNKEGGRWMIAPVQKYETFERQSPAVVNEKIQALCQGPLRFERERQAQEQKSMQMSIFVFVIGGAIAVLASQFVKSIKVLAAGFVLGGIVSFFFAGVQLWSMSAALGRLVTIIVLFIVVSVIGYFAFRDKPQ